MLDFVYESAGSALVYFILILVSQWRVYKKMGRKGWEGIIPIYNTFVLFKVLYGNGWRFLLFLIPIYDIYLFFKVNIDLARSFRKGVGFGLGLAFLAPIFNMILGFGSAVYDDNARILH